MPAAHMGVNPPAYQYERVTVGAHTADYATNCTKTKEYDCTDRCTRTCRAPAATGVLSGAQACCKERGVGGGAAQ